MQCEDDAFLTIMQFGLKRIAMKSDCFPKERRPFLHVKLARHYTPINLLPIFDSSAKFSRKTNNSGIFNLIITHVIFSGQRARLVYAPRNYLASGGPE